MGDLVTSTLLDEQNIDINFKTVKPAKIFSEAKIISQLVHDMKITVIDEERCNQYESNKKITS